MAGGFRVTAPRALRKQASLSPFRSTCPPDFSHVSCALPHPAPAAAAERAVTSEHRIGRPRSSVVRAMLGAMCVNQSRRERGASGAEPPEWHASLPRVIDIDKLGGISLSHSTVKLELVMQAGSGGSDPPGPIQTPHEGD